jgi:hypothetical protein
MLTPRDKPPTVGPRQGKTIGSRLSLFRLRFGAVKRFGSTIGNDAGLNLFHEFEPGIRQMVKGHTPKLAFKIEERPEPEGSRLQSDSITFRIRHKRAFSVLLNSERAVPLLFSGPLN